MTTSNVCQFRRVEAARDPMAGRIPASPKAEDATSEVTRLPAPVGGAPVVLHSAPEGIEDRCAQRADVLRAETRPGPSAQLGGPVCAETGRTEEELIRFLLEAQVAPRSGSAENARWLPREIEVAILTRQLSWIEGLLHQAQQLIHRVPDGGLQSHIDGAPRRRRETGGTLPRAGLADAAGMVSQRQ